ncbi:MAG: S-layer homology domain-containing protein [Clostridia bacterium]|nr:S-layer homology domain-containing protein [Clostridia bacterium]
MLNNKTGALCAGMEKEMKKRIMALIAAFSMTIAAANGVSALEYGEEWGGSGSSVSTPAVSKPGASTQVETPASSQTVSDGTYSDVPSSHWAFKAVERCSATKWFSGYPDGSFRPDGSITRAEAMKVFVTFMGEPLPDSVATTSYYDVSPTEWYATFIEAGKDLFPKRTSMDSQSKFQPDMPITREDTVYALVNALNYDQKVTNADLSVLNMFSDQNSISAVCRAHMAVAVSNGLVSGYSDGTIGAQDPLTRAQFATLLYRATFVGALEETNKTLTGIKVQPDTMVELNVGESFEISATASYSDGSTEDYTSKLNPYTDGAEGIITINKQKVTGVGAGIVVIVFNNDELKDENIVVIVKDPAAPAPVEPDPEPAEAENGEIKGKVEKNADVSSALELYTVLVMDVSGSMGGQPLDSAKEAAKLFCKNALNVAGKSNVAIVAYADTAEVISNFSDDLSALEASINGFNTYGCTNISEGLEYADNLLKSAPDNDCTVKSVVLMSDGLPNEGRYSTNGEFYDGYANGAVEAAEELHDDYKVYSLGFFHSVYDSYKDECRKIMEKTQNAGYYEVDDPSKLVNVFETISNKVVRNDAKIEVADGSGKVVMSVLTKDDCTFSVNVPEGDYTVTISSEGYNEVEKPVTVKASETADIGTVVLEAIQ